MKQIIGKQGNISPPEAKQEEGEANMPKEQTEKEFAKFFICSFLTIKRALQSQSLKIIKHS